VHTKSSFPEKIGEEGDSNAKETFKAAKMQTN